MKKFWLLALCVIAITLTIGTASANEEDCLGKCYTDDECSVEMECDGDNCDGGYDLPYVPCWYCIDALGGNSWQPNESIPCYGSQSNIENIGELCLSTCPDCSDGTDNDEDGGIDFLLTGFNDENSDLTNDEQCYCGLDNSEDEPCQPVPELSTLALVGVGLLGLVLMRRR